MKKVVVVTGGSSGIGKETVRLLRRKGCTVYALSRHPEQEPFALACDVTDADAAARCVESVLQKEGRIDVLINCAGFGISGACEFTDNADAHRQLEVNLFGTVNMSKAVLPAMRENCGGRIVNISSVAAVVPIPFQTWYSISKAAINTFTMALANEVKRFGISVCAVMPGDTKTGFTGAREESLAGDDVYGGVISKSVEKMKKDETNGVPPQKVAALAVKAALSGRVRPLYTCGFSYKLVVLLIRLLPSALANRLIGMLYAS